MGAMLPEKEERVPKTRGVGKEVPRQTKALAVAAAFAASSAIGSTFDAWGNLFRDPSRSNRPEITAFVDDTALVGTCVGVQAPELRTEGMIAIGRRGGRTLAALPPGRRGMYPDYFEKIPVDELSRLHHQYLAQAERFGSELRDGREAGASEFYDALFFMFPGGKLPASVPAIGAFPPDRSGAFTGSSGLNALRLRAVKAEAGVYLAEGYCPFAEGCGTLLHVSQDRNLSSNGVKIAYLAPITRCYLRQVPVNP